MNDAFRVPRANQVMSGPIVRVAPHTRARDAARAAIEEGARHVLVFETDVLVGTACICAIRDAPFATFVAERMKLGAHQIDATASIHDAAALMILRSLSCLPVVEAGVVVGVLTREDLRRAGVPEAALSRRRCAACGADDHVRADPRGGETRFCTDCIDAAEPHAWHEDLGGD